MKVFRLYLLIIISIVFSSCTYQFDNPVDRNGSNYQGWVSGSDVSETVPLIIVQTEPSRDSLTNDHTPLLDWADVSNADHYYVKWALTEAGLADSVEVKVQESAYQVEAVLFNDDEVFWTVRSCCAGGGSSGWSVPEKFKIIQRVDDYSGLFPHAGKCVVDSMPSFNWDDVENSSSYQIRFSKTEEGLADSEIKTHTESCSSYPEALSDGDRVYWQIRSVDLDGVPSAWSKVLSFYYEQPIVPMINVVGGNFIMGDEWGDGRSDELPLHRVILSTFALSCCEVEYSIWKEIYDWAVNEGYEFDNSGRAGNDGLPTDTDDEPVTMISWRDAIVWCNAASERAELTPVYTKSGNTVRSSLDADGDVCDSAICNWAANGYRLPTEAEWEYAAKGGFNDIEGGKYSGDSVLGNVGWYSENSELDTRTVGTKAENEVRLKDMSGNVLEWCWDWFSMYGTVETTDPRGAESGDAKVYRGGAANQNSFECRVSARRNYGPYGGNVFIGLRLARSY